MKYFAITEFECHCKCGRNDMDLTFLAKLDELRGRYGKPLTVSSGFRCPSYNAKVSETGVSGPHTTGKAVDFRIDRTDAYELIGHAIAMGFTGIGVQQKGSARFVHLDTLTNAPGQPRPTVWSY